MEKIKRRLIIQVSATGKYIECNEDYFLRELLEADSQHIYELYKDAELLKYTDERPHVSIVDSSEFIKHEKKRILDNCGICWGIIENASQNLAGIIRIKDIDFKNYSATIGYYLKKEYWGKGLASLSLNNAIDQAFNYMNLHRLEAQVYTKHDSSIRVLEKSGFKREGQLKENFLIMGKFRDSYVYGLTSES